ncbi:hypothetical protein FHC47_20515 [Klebsiella quasipneumoniae]|nr:ATP cone domain-containing protein [Klebsiella quasipneumoniae]MCS6332282.1 hypothetical protein [Klebsiella pneumoniae]PLF70660.1 hypothetical protein B6I99_27865 [Klebsiella quasipneumoniae]RBQ55710.1 hypothetical protein C2128_03580 [Klebsiella pneumoniae]TNC54208.1 hypothetical protein FHC47_20515 [Klebsiella quasipneumoniae]HBR0345167.1 hypothetical protein [Klebsiella pneumoniae]
MTPHVMKRDGSRVLFDSDRIKEAILRAAIAAGIEDVLSEMTGRASPSSNGCRFVGLVRNAKRVVFFVFRSGTIKRFVLSASCTLRKNAILYVLSTVTIIRLLKASGRLARSPPNTNIPTFSEFT